MWPESPVSRRATVLVALALGAVVVVAFLALLPLAILAAAGVLR